jgi:hypothetical protein
MPSLALDCRAVYQRPEMSSAFYQLLAFVPEPGRFLPLACCPPPPPDFGFRVRVLTTYHAPPPGFTRCAMPRPVCQAPGVRAPCPGAVLFEIYRLLGPLRWTSCAIRGARGGGIDRRSPPAPWVQ